MLSSCINPNFGHVNYGCHPEIDGEMKCEIWK